ncbi:transcription/translation regulatory transformer protein RfaH [Ahniella affigens]|uniref:Transcription/translation regulatory transformer protein RfaH n=1 Tax=Ahniella affigens TaxID=2021234 RepID=A0A2P1PYH2_9GAMM|nr:transcription termination/antitermination NusG family protein [Ahniella affigens]AVP99895.1 transcription/translation regulatory transformer protein RfaH [Ahniella affigens]
MLSQHSDSAAWFAVLTKPRSEALAGLNLRRQGFEVLDCRLRRSRPGADGLCTQIEPLFPRYLFIRSDAHGLRLGPVRSTRGVSQVVRFGANTPSVPDPVIAAIVARQDADGFVRLDPPGLCPGQRVKVTEGPMAGFEGIFESHSGHARVRLLIDLLGTPVQVTLPSAQLARRI